jgi:hypothetical protein
MSISISDSPGEDAARSLMDRVARSIAGAKDWSGGFPQSRDDLRRELREAEVEGIGAITVTDQAEVAMGSTGEVRVAAVEAGRALLIVGRFAGDEEIAEVIGGMLGERVRAGEFFVARAIDPMGNIETEKSAMVRNALTGLRAAKD